MIPLYEKRVDGARLAKHGLELLLDGALAKSFTGGGAGERDGSLHRKPVLQHNQYSLLYDGHLELHGGPDRGVGHGLFGAHAAPAIPARGVFRSNSLVVGRVDEQ